VSTVTCTLAEVTQKYKSSADFLAVYITEAHARDEWPAGSKLSTCSQPTTREERLALANQLVESKQMSMPMLVDDIDNRFEQVFAAWPVRFYVLQNGIVAFKAQPTAFMNGYDFDEVARFLDSAVSRASASSTSVDKEHNSKKRGAAEADLVDE